VSDSMMTSTQTSRMSPSQQRKVSRNDGFCHDCARKHPTLRGTPRTFWIPRIYAEQCAVRSEYHLNKSVCDPFLTPSPLFTAIFDDHFRTSTGTRDGRRTEISISRTGENSCDATESTYRVHDREHIAPFKNLESWAAVRRMALVARRGFFCRSRIARVVARIGSRQRVPLGIGDTDSRKSARQ